MGGQRAYRGMGGFYKEYVSSKRNIASYIFHRKVCWLKNLILYYIHAQALDSEHFLMLIFFTQVK